MDWSEGGWLAKAWSRVLSTILGRTPTVDEYKSAVEGINLTDFAPPLEDLTTKAANSGVVPLRISPSK